MLRWPQEAFVPARIARVDQRRVRNPDAEQQSVTVLVGQVVVLRSDVGRFVHPEIEDARRDDRLGGCLQEVGDGIEHRSADVGNPQRGESQLIELCRCLRGLGEIAVTQLRTPNSYACKLQDCPPRVTPTCRRHAGTCVPCWSSSALLVLVYAAGLLRRVILVHQVLG